ncbi:MAG: 3-oxoacyl-ACP synthase, partial [Draconibacterium sp.]|nr:3-oxoacyl-ACP synthase [Draconibacterium sp.]
NFELEKSRMLLNKTLNTKNELLQIKLHKKNDKVTLGSLVITNNGNYFIAIAIGKIEVANKIYYSISLSSPVGKILYNKNMGDQFQFQKRNFTILKIV